MYVSNNMKPLKYKWSFVIFQKKTKETLLSPYFNFCCRILFSCIWQLVSFKNMFIKHIFYY
jgi:hypothetical protein